MRARVVVTVLLLLVFFRASGRGADSQSKKDASTGASTADPNTPSAPIPSYVIGAEDILRVSVWKEPELTAQLPVRSDGKISLPLVNDVQAAGLTPMELAASLTEKLKKYIDDPRVAVVVTQMNHQRIYVLGEVARHGPIPLVADMTVLQALATSGLTQFANTNKIYVLRAVNGVEKKFPVNYKRLVKGQGMSQNILLKAGDTIVVP
jgi:polysaccharide export outer membrane protein